MTREVDDFRISIAGAQEKTGLLWHNQKWCLPTGPTPTSHIFKLPIGVIANHNIDLSESCENEWLCLKIAEAFGLPVAKADIQTFEDVKVLVVERFDRKWSRDKSWLMRLPQEDMCQVLGVASGNKYQADGGPSIVEIMKVLMGSKQPQVDREQFFKSQILFWLLAAIDGHGKNFSVYLDPNASYRLTPLYDVLSAYPSMQIKEIPKQKAKMAMALKGKQNRYEWSQIQLRHFLSTAKAAAFSKKQTISLLLEMLEKTEFIAQQVQEQLPKDFPTHISQPILEGMTSLAKQHLPALYQLIADYADEGDYESATAFYKKAISIKTEVGDEQGQIGLLRRIANLCNDDGDFELAIKYHLVALDIATVHNDFQNKAAILRDIADVYHKHRRFEHAIAFYLQALELLKLKEQVQDDSSRIAILKQIERIYKHQGKSQQVRSLYEKYG
nr:HipA domain-containing protein [Acaryochloris sp. IP29b_bin.137]